MPYFVFGNETSSTSAPSSINVSTACLTDVLISSDTPSPRYSVGNATLRPWISLPMSDVKSEPSTGALVESFSSTPVIVSNTKALSLTLRVNGPIWSNDEANATKPKRDTRPYVGFIPTMPQYAAG